MRIFLILSAILFSFIPLSQPLYSWDEEKIEVKKGNENNTILSAKSIISEGWSELAQPIFWKQVMELTPDSVLINIAASRIIVSKMSEISWNKQTESQKNNFRDSIRTLHGLASEDRIFCTTGKNDFYKFDIVYESISEGVEAFEKYNVDPWYAQAILLIESPGQLKKSKVGAYGPFQLMPSVARAQGLTVSKYKDERSDFNRSAYGASRLIKRVCIPEAKRILNSNDLDYKEGDIWFRLFVLHVYHAGAGNVRAVMNKISPKVGGQELIKSMWQNTAASFGNNSQNYSQIALASQLILHEIVHENCDYILDCALLD
ncbi:MAG: transglycosylase SLT domain-containing protein [Crocinitomicaceae bacterium]